MTRHDRIALVSVMGLLVATAAPSAQEAAGASFGALESRLQIGQEIWVTDRAGRESHGMLERLAHDGLVLKADRLETFSVFDIRDVRARETDPLKNGTWIGFGVGAGMGSAWCLGALADDSGDIDARVECAEGFIVFPGLGALIGLAVDAAIPGRVRVVYRAAPTKGNSHLGLNFVPLLSARAKGVCVSLSF